MSGQVGKTDLFKWAAGRPVIPFMWLILSPTAGCSEHPL